MGKSKEQKPKEVYIVHCYDDDKCEEFNTIEELKEFIECHVDGGGNLINDISVYKGRRINVEVIKNVEIIVKE